MTRIDCRAATGKGLSPEEYIDRFVDLRKDCVLLEVDEEGNDIIILDPCSAEYLGRKLLAMVQEIRR